MRIRRKRDATFDNSVDVIGPGVSPGKKHPSITAALSYAQNVAVRATAPVTITVREFEESLYHVRRDAEGVVLTYPAREAHA